MSGPGGQPHSLAETLQQQADQLSELDDARSRWLAHTAGTRAAAERAKAELAARHADDIDPEPKVTAAEWLAAHRAAVADDELHREITETDVGDEGRDAVAAEDETVAVQEDEVDEPADDHHEEPWVAEHPDRDIREVAADEPRPQAEDDVRVPSADETAAAVESAQRALVEIKAREVADAAAEEQHRAEQLSRWHDHDQTVDAAETGAEDVDEPDLVDADQP